jgi:hypothetical protein
MMKYLNLLGLELFEVSFMILEYLAHQLWILTTVDTRKFDYCLEEFEDQYMRI